MGIIYHSDGSTSCSNSTSSSEPPPLDEPILDQIQRLCDSRYKHPAGDAETLSLIFTLIQQSKAVT